MNIRVFQELRPHLFHFCEHSAGHREVSSECGWREGKGPCRMLDFPVQLAWEMTTELCLEEPWIWSPILPQSLLLWDSWSLEALFKSWIGNYFQQLLPTGSGCAFSSQFGCLTAYFRWWNMFGLDHFGSRYIDTPMRLASSWDVLWDYQSIWYKTRQASHNGLHLLFSLW